MDFRDKVLSDFPNLPEWQLKLWNKISFDAKSKGSFPNHHFDDTGLIRAYAKEYHRLFDWLVSENVCKLGYSLCF